MSIDQIASTILEKLKEISRTETVVGKPISAGPVTLIPVSKVSVGFGLGGNTGKSETTASGGGASVEPIAFIAISKDKVEVQTLGRNKDVLSKVVDLIPSALEKLASRKYSKAEEDGQGKKKK